MIDGDRSVGYVSETDLDAADSSKMDDYTLYIADMILEMQCLAAKSGRAELAKRLLAAYELARAEDVGGK